MTEQEDFEIMDTASWIFEMGLKAVALQIPDDLLGKAAWIVARLSDAANTLNWQVRFFVLADTSVSSWDPDIVAAQHVSADGLIVYGRASLGRTEAMPTRHVFGRMPVDILSVVMALETWASLVANETIILIPAVCYSHSRPTLEAALDKSRLNAVVAEPFSENESRYQKRCQRSGNGIEECRNSKCDHIPSINSCCDQNACCTSQAVADGPECASSDPIRQACGDCIDTTNCVRLGHFIVRDRQRQSMHAESAASNAFQSSTTTDGTLIRSFSISPQSPVVYIGEQGPELTRLILENPQRRFVQFDPLSGALRTDLFDCARALKRRYYHMMRARDAMRIGVVVSTTAVSGYVDMVARLRRVIAGAGKRPYVFFVGKINPAKLANFAEIDVFVLVASPETTVSIDFDSYYKPIVTPMELEIALVKGKEWTGQYDLDFRNLLATPLPETDDCDKTDLDEDANVASQSLTRRRTDGLSVTTAPGVGVLTALGSAAAVLATRTFQGLDPEEGKARPLGVVQGRVGIASVYQHEPGADLALSAVAVAAVGRGTAAHTAAAVVRPGAMEAAHPPAAQGTATCSASGPHSTSHEQSSPATAHSARDCQEVNMQGSAADPELRQGSGYRPATEAEDSDDMQQAAAEVDSFLDAFV